MIEACTGDMELFLTEGNSSYFSNYLVFSFMSPGGAVPLAAMFEDGPWNESDDELETSPETRLPNRDFNY